MAQCFVSTYRNHYRRPELKKTLPIKPTYVRLESVIPNKIWLRHEPVDDELTLQELEETYNQIKKRHARRYITTYQYYYCGKDMISLTRAETGEYKDMTEDQLVLQGKKLFEPDPRPKILPPLPGSRKMFGYLRPTRNYTPLTCYQHYFGRTAYKILKGGKNKSGKVNEGKPDEGELKIKQAGHFGSGDGLGGEGDAVEPQCDCCSSCECPLKKLSEKTEDN